MKPLEKLRAAAQLLRERGGRATPGPWRTAVGDSENVGAVLRVCDSLDHPDEDADRVWVFNCCHAGEMHGGEFYREADAYYIATVHPGVGVQLADLMDHEAARVEMFHGSDAPESVFGPVLALAGEVLHGPRPG